MQMDLPILPAMGSSNCRYPEPRQTIRRTVPVTAIALLLISFAIFPDHEVMAEQIRL